MISEFIAKRKTFTAADVAARSGEPVEEVLQDLRQLYDNGGMPNYSAAMVFPDIPGFLLYFPTPKWIEERCQHLRLLIDEYKFTKALTNRKTVYLEHYGEHKIHCIKALRELFGLGLKDAKRISEQSHFELLCAAPDDEVEICVKTLKAAGVEVSVVPA